MEYLYAPVDRAYFKTSGPDAVHRMSDSTAIAHGRRWVDSVMITLGLSLHRPEMVPVMARWMQRHDVILLEEPPDRSFKQMLKGALRVDDYVMTLDHEYPDFTRRMCRLMRKLNATDKSIFQVEPYLECLLMIHQFFADGHRPDELAKNTLQFQVYMREREVTAALIAYYRTAMNGSFEQTIDAVKRFAKSDAARFRLRDSLRAQALAPQVEQYRSAYIESGVMHYQLGCLLRNQLSQPKRLKIVFLADELLKQSQHHRHLYGPGDLLTLHYIFQPALDQPHRETVLAARSLIYAKILNKEEVGTALESAPHLRDELECIHTVQRLSIQDCRHLFYRIRNVDTGTSRQIVAAYLQASKVHRPPEQVANP